MTITTAKTIGLIGSVESFELHDPLGNTCAAALFKNGVSEFELYLWDFNSAIPRRVTGSVSHCKHFMTQFFHAKVAGGFIEPLADVSGNPIN